ncbi:amino acid adenylation enzyme/thioester reductase family protein [Pseudomonas asplenii]|uniref:Amino acid adenylation enzyme/thioester reductase family protein n=1 Tax=Pseudomonas asplenii TaxID=53407 RepID=A0A0N0VJI5_9PSED|nr:non-ribosomal peptide synthetase [Pseudomonas fuscovaginae]KPA90492.1 amino acid adenylation enzyme/thioester reductase family protein [Pseudomonas fuscovaginae]
MKPQDAQKLARRFIELPQDKRSLFLAAMDREGVDFSLLPIAACEGVAERDGLSYAQQRMWFLWQLDPRSAAYNLPMAVRLQGPLDLAALEQAFSALIARHECLRTTFGQDGERAFQRVAPARAATVRVDDLQQLDEAQRRVRARQIMADEAGQAFDLQQGPLLSIRLLRLAEQEQVLLLTLHHIIADGWSMNILIEEFSRCYDACVAGSTAELSALAVHYRDYALWQRSWLEAGEQARQLAYWREHLGEEHPVLELPTDRPHPAQASHRGARLEVRVDSDLRQQLKALAQRQGVSLFVVLLASFKSLLHRYSGQSDIRVGGLIANRTRSETEGLIGFFVNTQVLRSEVRGQTPFVELLHSLRQAAAGAQAHQELPFDALIEALQPARSQSHNPLFQVMFNHQPLVTDVQGRQLASGLRVALLDEEQGVGQGRQHAAASDLMLETREEGEQLFAAFTYATDIFDGATIERLAGHWRNLLVAVCRDPQQPIGQLPMLAAEEVADLLGRGDEREVPADSPLSMVQLFEAQARRTPDATALILADAAQAPSLSYAELNRRANRLAHLLRGHGVGPEVLVGLAIGRTLDLAVAILAVLKAGGAYVPLDPQMPPARLAHVLQDSGLKLLLTHSQWLDGLPPLGDVEALCLDRINDGGYAQADLELAPAPQSLAYVIYTSGSTGRPKGVGISHQALAEFVARATEYSELLASDRVLQFATSSFDGFVEQFFPPLSLGACVVLRDERLWDSTTLHEAILRHGITLADLPAAYWHLLVQDWAARPPAGYGALRQIHIGGEAMAVDGLRLWPQAGLGGVRLVNTYGPTEATVVSSTYDCTGLSAEAVSWRGVPIGFGLARRRLLVLDGDLELLPRGAVGELYIGGPGLARGYQGQPALSAERFIADPFTPGERLYRTGDRARLREDGAVEYIGRVDHQVKVRGFRIELGEVESRLLQCPGVREAAVLALPLAGGTQLVGYLVPDQALEPAQQSLWRLEVKASLQGRLPDYMIPSHLLVLPRMPLTPSGKLDRKALPVPDPSQLQASYREPQTETERCLATIWEEVLQVPRVGLDDHFFELGGHSLLAAQVIARVKTRLEVSLPLRSLFEKPLLSELAAELAMLAQGAADNDWADMEQFMSSLEEFGA